MLGIGVGHREHLEAGRYQRPLTAMREYLDLIDAAPRPVPIEERVLAALGARMLGVARDRSRGSHPYLVTPEHTRQARERLGAGKLLAPEHAVALETDPDRARAFGRQHLERYLALPNYTDNWLRLGFTTADLAGGGSDRLVDALVAWGDAAAVRRAALAHLEAGADHVCLQVLDPDPRAFPSSQWAQLAPAFGLRQG
jgi:probable F420-dependent oxidoreductase